MLSLAFSVIAGIALSDLTGTTKWGRLEVTWGPPFSNAWFDHELTETKAIKAGYTQILRCGIAGSPGNVYVDENYDISSMPIYNADGLISGIILAVDDPGQIVKDDMEAFTFTEYTVYIQRSERTIYGVQAMFRDPDTICDAGASSSSVTVGDRLWFKQGTEYMKIPLLESESSTLDSLGFVKGGCFTTMGQHYWQDISADMDCDDFKPIFLLYNGGKLNGWGIGLGHSDSVRQTSKYWEHPPASALHYFFQSDSLPTCLPAAEDRLSTQHVYMTTAALNICPLW